MICWQFTIDKKKYLTSLVSLRRIPATPAGYSFTDLLKPTREFSEETQSHRGNAIFTTDRLLELHGGQRINTEANLDFYIQRSAGHS